MTPPSWSSSNAIPALLTLLRCRTCDVRSMKLANKARRALPVILRFLIWSQFSISLSDSWSRWQFLKTMLRAETTNPAGIWNTASWALSRHQMTGSTMISSILGPAFSWKLFPRDIKRKPSEYFWRTRNCTSVVSKYKYGVSQLFQSPKTLLQSTSFHALITRWRARAIPIPDF